MKIRKIALLLIALAGVVPSAQLYARKAESTKQMHTAYDKLLKAIEEVNVTEVERLLVEEKDLKSMLDEHNGVFSPLGKVMHEIERNKKSKLAKADKMQKTKSLRKIEKILKKNGAALIFDNAANMAAGKE